MGRRMKHTEIGEIPADWELQTFEETFRVLSNNTVSRENLNNRNGTVRNIHYGDILTKFTEVLNCNEGDIPYLNDLSLITASTQLLQDGDIVIADTAEDETVGKTIEVQNLGNGKLVAGLHTIPCRVKKGKFAPGWLGYYMNSHIYHDQILPFITGIKVSSISKTSIAETIILVPPIDEQERIIETLMQIEKLIKKEAVIIDKFKSFKSGCLTKMFPTDRATTPEIRCSEYTDAWEQRKLGELGEILTGSTPSTSHKEYYSDNGIPWVTPTDILENIIYDTPRKLSDKGQEIARIAPKGTILVTCIASIGRQSLMLLLQTAMIAVLMTYLIRCTQEIFSEETKMTALQGAVSEYF